MYVVIYVRIIICTAQEFETAEDAVSFVPCNSGESETRDTAGSFVKWVPAFTNRVFHTGKYANSYINCD